MNFYIGITDQAWFDYLSSLSPPPDEVNFWQPSGKTTFRALQPGELFLFKLHSLNEGRNSILLRSDKHKLFDKGYLTITPKLHTEVSRRIKEEFDNGGYYFMFHGKKINRPLQPVDQPSIEFLNWYNNKIFKA